MIHEMKTAPRDGKLIWLFSEDEWAGPRAAYWGQVSGVYYWRALTGEWINGATGWSTIPIYSPTKDEAPCPVCGNEERAQGGYLSCECPASPSTDDFVSRAEVLRVIRSLGAQDADLAMYGAADNARAREYGEAAATRACCAIALMPPASPSPAPAAVEELVARHLQSELAEAQSKIAHLTKQEIDIRTAYQTVRAENLHLARENKRLDREWEAARAALSTLAADKARIEAERDGWKANCQVQLEETHRNMRAKAAAEARASALEGEVERLKEVARRTANGDLANQRERDAWRRAAEKAEAELRALKLSAAKETP